MTPTSVVAPGAGAFLMSVTTRNPTQDRVELDGQLKFQLRPNLNEGNIEARS
jgi:hypothetical protein